jgi:hypothetical protein
MNNADNALVQRILTEVWAAHTRQLGAEKIPVIVSGVVNGRTDADVSVASTGGEKNALDIIPTLRDAAALILAVIAIVKELKPLFSKERAEQAVRDKAKEKGLTAKHQPSVARRLDDVVTKVVQEEYK